MAYFERDLVKIAKRENNKKRSYLVVDPLQGKHIPVSPNKALALFDELAQSIKEEYKGERLLVAGFAETATAIGAQIAVSLKARYIQTTREIISGEDYIFFLEEHSHASEQKLVKNAMDRVMDSIDRVIFAEDEVTTGNTILNIINILEKSYKKKISYSVASLLNGMDNESMSAYKDRGIKLHYLLKTDHSAYSEIAESYESDGSYIRCGGMESAAKLREAKVQGWHDPRRLVSYDELERVCMRLCLTVEGILEGAGCKNILVAGTEECMYPALYAGSYLEKKGFIVKCHSTTRSPIAVSRAAGYPLHVRYELKSLYDKNRTTYIYDIGSYDAAVIITDACNGEIEGINSLAYALGTKIKNGNINLVRLV